MATVNVLQPENQYKTINTNLSIISIWKKQAYESQIFTSKIQDYGIQISAIASSIDNLNSQLMKLNKAIDSLKRILTLIELERAS